MLSRIQIRQFLAVVDTGSFTRAASALNIAQPSLSGGIAELERHLGARLFERERRRIRLTEAGNLLLPLARSIENGFHQAEAAVSNLPVPRRPIRLGVLETVSSDWLEQVLGRYAGSDPLELIEGSERELLSALSNGSIELAVMLVPAEATRFTSETLLREEYCLALPASHALAQRESLRTSDVAGETMIARRSCEVLAETSRFFTERGVRPRFSLRSPNDDRVMAMVRAGLGVTVAPRSLGRAGVAMLRLEDFDRHRTIGVLYGAEWAQNHAADHAIVTALRGAAKSLPN